MDNDKQPNVREATLPPLSRLQWWAFSVPLFVKVMGIVLLVSAIFGTVLYVELGASLRHTRYQMHVEAAYRATHSLISLLETVDLSRDSPNVGPEITRLLEGFPDVSYVVVQDADGRILGHHFGFPADIPHDLTKRSDEVCSACHAFPTELSVPTDLIEVANEPDFQGSRIRRYSRTAGTILEVTVPLRGVSGRTVRVGYRDAAIDHEMGSITKALVRSLIICVAIGQGLALLMTYLLVRPVLNLVEATNAIRAGDFSSRAKVYSADEVGMLARAFNLMASNLQTYRNEVEKKEAARVALMQKIVRAHEEERVSVARELHDQLGQSLSKTLLSFQSLQREAETMDPRYRELEDEIRGLIDDVRRLAWELRPAILDDYGLDSALDQYIKESARRAGLSIDYLCDFPPDGARLPNEIEVILYRVAQEAVTNVIRHAEASRASVVLLRHNTDVMLVVEDDGRGFSVDQIANGGDAALGLMGMKERVSLAGGFLRIESEPGKGSVIKATIPCDVST